MTPEQREARRAANARYYAKKKQDPEFRAKRVAATLAWAEKNPDRARDTRLRTKRRAAGIIDATAERRAGPCEICGTPADPLHLDHDHSTGRIRGWLCYNCNRGIGHLQDSPRILRAAITYLESTCAKKM